MSGGAGSNGGRSGMYRLESWDEMLEKSLSMRLDIDRARQQRY